MRFLAAILLPFIAASWLVAQQSVAPASASASPAVAAGGQTSSQPPQPASESSQPGSTPSQDISAASSQPSAAKQNAAPATAEKTVILPTVSHREAAEAKRQFQAGVKLKKKGHLDAAFDKFCSASELDPRNVNYLTAREFTREELAMRALEAGNKAMLQHNQIVAMADFQRALKYDPTNDYALQRLRDAMPEPEASAQKVSAVEQSLPIQLRPAAKHQDFHFRGDSYALLSEVARAYGITAQFDDSVKHLHVHYDIQNVNFFTAMGAANGVTNTFWAPLSSTQVLLLANTAENHRNFDRMGLRTFYLSDLNAQELTQMTNSLRVLLNLRYVSMVRAQNTITIRANLPVLEAASQVIHSLTTGRPEVLLDMQVFAVSSNFARSLGTALPTQFTMFNISPALLTSLAPSSQNLINQLIASGGINQANSSAISALLAQLQNSATGSILTTPFVIFGGGLTLFGLNAGGQGISPTFSLNTSNIRSLEHATLRCSHNAPAVLKIGERYPVINATFSPIYNSSSIASVIGNQSYIAPFPSFNYEDLGLIVKTTPLIHANGDVTMKLELEVRSLGTTNVNGIPIIHNREYKGSITVQNGESSVVTGMIDMNDTRSIAGYPFLGQVPGLGYGGSVHNKNVRQDELLVVITPHALSLPEHASFAIELPPDH